MSAYLSLPPENGQEIIELPLWSTVVPDGEGKDWYMGVTGSCGGLWQRVSDMSVFITGCYADDYICSKRSLSGQWKR